jgi:uncharacterized small protein (DUF1192 family)
MDITDHDFGPGAQTRVRRNQAFQQRSIECRCDPPGSGEEHCTGHCVLRAEIERLKAYEQMWHEQYASDLVQARAEIERLRIELHRVAESRRGQRERAECAEAENGRLRAAYQQIENAPNEDIRKLAVAHMWTVLNEAFGRAKDGQ